MSYKNPDKFIFEDGGIPDDFLEDIISRKEFAMYAVSSDGTGEAGRDIKKGKTTKTTISEARRYLKDKRFDLNDEIKRGNYLFLHSYQKFLENLMNPSTDFNRILVGWQAGSGKTLPPLKIGINMLDAQMYANPEEMGNVIILGFTQSTFKRELLKYPELGFLSREEYDEYQSMYHRALEGSQLDQETLREFLLRIKRRMTSRATHRARFVFMGYKQFANKLFLKNPKYEAMYLGDIERSDITSSDPTKKPIIAETPIETFSIHELNEEQMRHAIDEGKVIVNQTLLLQFRNSFLVCDEIHKVYNSEEQNHWGVAISYVLNYPGINLKVMYLSATPMNNHHTEIVDLLNMLLPPPYNKINKSDLFVEPNYGDLKPGALDLIGRLTAGRVSFLQDQDPRYYPKQLWVGEKIQGIEILKFVRCRMTQFHYNTYNEVYNGTLSQESLYLVDFALPNPSDPKHGMYQTSQIISELEHASDAWKEKHGLYMQNGILTGPIMLRENIKKYSSKYDTLLGIIFDIIKLGGQKAFIYHDAVHISGVLFIQELFKYNGIIDESSPSTTDTLCVICGKPKHTHKLTEESQAALATETEEVQLTNLVQVMDSIEGGGHQFIPVRFMIAHSDMDKGLLTRNMEKYNSTENMHGRYILFIVGSQLMRESHDMKHLRHEIVVNLAGGVPALVQIFGRGVRNNSHKGAPADEWTVKRYILVSSLPVGMRGYSYEEERYIKKVKIYKIIQKIEKVMHEYALDAALNYSKVMRVIERGDSLSILPYTPRVGHYEHLNTSTYRILYAEHEVGVLVGIIKRVFIEWNPIWKFDDLWAFISDPLSPVASDVNFQVQLLSKEYFVVALTRLITPQVVSIEEKTNILDKTFDPADRIIVIDGEYVIEHVGEYYMLVPLINRRPKIDVESPFRHTDEHRITQRISLDDVMDKNAPTLEEEFELFVEEHRSSSFEDLNNILCLYTLEFHEFILRKIIPWVNMKLTNQKVEHLRRDTVTFYIRLLYQYNISGIIVWASSSDLVSQYAKWVKPLCSLSTRKDCAKVHVPNTKCNWCPAGILAKYVHDIGTTLRAIENGDKIGADLLPVGYIIKTGFLFGINGWMEYQPPIINARENDIIIGYDERAEDDIVVKFKIRNPKHKIARYKDVRRIEKGTACSSKNKESLLKLAKELQAPYDHTNVHSLCTAVRDRLLYLETIERQKPPEKRTRWFYHVHELHE